MFFFKTGFSVWYCIGRQTEPDLFSSVRGAAFIFRSSGMNLNLPLSEHVQENAETWK